MSDIKIEYQTVSLEPKPIMLIVNAEKIILRNKEIEIDIDITKSISQFEKIIINGITFVKEKEDD